MCAQRPKGAKTGSANRGTNGLSELDGELPGFGEDWLVGAPGLDLGPAD